MAFPIPNGTTVRAVLLFSAAIAAEAQVWTYHYDNARTGATPNEPILTTSDVMVSSFGKLFTMSVDGQVYAQPLYVPLVSIPQQGVHDVVYVATQNNSVYAFDADVQGGPLWHVNLGPAMPTSTCCTTGSLDIIPQIGITSTPVIDLLSGTLYVVAETLESGATVFRLHALDFTTGNDKITPVVIQGNVPGTSVDSASGVLTFNPAQQRQRLGLLLLNGNVYVGFGSHEDSSPWHGWLFGYNGATLKLTSVVCFAPNGVGNGAWQGGVAPAADANSNIYVETGNGPLDANTGGEDYGDSIVKLGTGNGLAILDYFSPSTQLVDDDNDWDLGSSGPVLIPGSTLGVAGGKTGELYVFNTSNLGQFNSLSDQVVQEWQATTAFTGNNPGGFWAGNYIFYNSTLYGFGEGDYLKAFAFNGSQFNTTPVSESSFQVPTGTSNDPAMSISANGTTPGTGIVWAAFSTSGNPNGNDEQFGAPYPGVLHAFDASNVSHELWNSNQLSARDYTGNWAKWAPPIVANGKVYLPTFDNLVDAYGLLPATVQTTGISLVQQASGSNGGNNLNTLTVTLTKTPSSGNVLILIFDQIGASQTITSISGATWTQIGKNQTAQGDLEVWAGTNPTSSTITITGATYFGTFQPGYGIVAEYSGVSATPDGVAVSTSGGTWPAVTGNLTAGNAADLLITAVLSYNGGGTSATVNYPWTLLTAPAGSLSLAAAWQSTQKQGSYTATWNGAGTPQAPTIIVGLTSSCGAANISAIGGAPQSAPPNSVFKAPLLASVRSNACNPMSGATVTFTVQGSGAGATFAGSASATAVTNSSGVAIAPTLTANGQTGTYAVVASVGGVAQPASFLLTNGSGSGSLSSISATKGTPQSTTVSTAFGTPLQATVTNGGNPVSGATVTFTAPGSGASATFAGQASATALTNSSGVATAPALTANSQAGSYTVTATVSGATSPASFSLTNVAATSPIISATAGTPQSATVSTAFGTPLQATVTNGGNPASGATVTFTAPGSGASATFAGQASTTALTNSSGVATAPALTANSQAGTYTVTATVSGATSPATFSLTNNSAVQSNGASLVQQAAGLNPGNNQNTLTVTLTKTPSSGNVLILIFDQIGVSQTITSISGATWTQIGKNQTAQGDLEVWAGTNPTSLTITITGTTYFGTFQPGYGIVAEYSGVSATPDGVAVSTTGGTWPAVTGNLATGNAADLLITAVLSYNGGGVSATVSSPWTLFTAPAGSSSLAAAWHSTQTLGSYSAIWNGSGSPQAPTILLALKASGSSPSPIIGATAGTPQSTTVSTAFGTPLQATVTNGGNPVSGATVTFTAPGSGARATFAGQASATALTNSSGVATAPALTANSQAGSYTITATVSGATSPASFSLTNVAATSPIISATAGTLQSTTASTAFGTPLQATVTNGGNPVSGATVTFTAPGSGASATFAGQASTTALTNSSGVATAPALTANSQAGTYTVTATVSGATSPATFSLTNNSAVQSNGASLVQQAAGLNPGNNQYALTVTLTKTPSSGNVLILIFDQIGVSQTITSISGATWTQIGKNQTAQGDLEVWAGTNPTSSTITITGTTYFGTFQPGYGIVAEYSGVSATPDGVAVSTTGGAWPAVTGNLATGNAADLLITAVLSYNGGGVSATVNSPWTLLTAPAGTYSLAAAWHSTQALGSYSAIWNGSGSPQAPTILLALKP